MSSFICATLFSVWTLNTNSVVVVVVSLSFFTCVFFFHLHRFTLRDHLPLSLCVVHVRNTFRFAQQHEFSAQFISLFFFGREAMSNGGCCPVLMPRGTILRYIYFAGFNTHMCGSVCLWLFIQYSRRCSVALSSVCGKKNESNWIEEKKSRNWPSFDGNNGPRDPKLEPKTDLAAKNEMSEESKMKIKCMTDNWRARLLSRVSPLCACGATTTIFAAFILPYFAFLVFLNFQHENGHEQKNVRLWPTRSRRKSKSNSKCNAISAHMALWTVWFGYAYSVHLSIRTKSFARTHASHICDAYEWRAVMKYIEWKCRIGCSRWNYSMEIEWGVHVVL